MTNRRKPTAGFWITVTLVAVLVGYPLSFGPACWAMDRIGTRSDLAEVIYRPLLLLAVHGPTFISRLLFNYANLYTRDCWTIDPVEAVFVRCHPLF